MNKEQFVTMLEEKGINLSPQQLQQFATYYKLLVEWNEKMNLTAIKEEEEVYLKHFYDSISATFYDDFTRPLTLIDVGAGAGFPSIPIKICFPHLTVHIVDSLNKRIGFLTHLAERLELKNVAFFHDRAETFAHKKEHRQRYDLAIARAVARLPVLLELCLPLVRKGGSFIAMKGASGKEELLESKKALAILGGELVERHSFMLPFEESAREIIRIAKREHSPKKYPRKPGTPNRSPLV